MGQEDDCSLAEVKLKQLLLGVPMTQLESLVELVMQAVFINDFTLSKVVGGKGRPGAMSRGGPMRTAAGGRPTEAEGRGPPQLRGQGRHWDVKVSMTWTGGCRRVTTV